MYLAIELANRISNGLYLLYLNANGFYKMGSLVFCIIYLYFNFTAYRYYKQLALEIFEYEHQEEKEEKY